MEFTLIHAESDEHESCPSGNCFRNAPEYVLLTKQPLNIRFAAYECKEAESDMRQMCHWSGLSMKATPMLIVVRAGSDMMITHPPGHESFLELIRWIAEVAALFLDLSNGGGDNLFE
jgi:hypothetical protein